MNTMNTFNAVACYLPKKKDKVITLRISEDDFNIVESFAKSKRIEC